MFFVCVLHWIVFVYPGNRERFLEAIPSHTMDIITSSVSGMILHDAFVVGNLIQDTGNPLLFISSLSTIVKPPVTEQAVLVITMTTIIFISYAFFRHNAEHYTKRQNFIVAGLFDIFSGAVLLASVPVSAVIASSWAGIKLQTMEIQEHVTFQPLPFKEGLAQIFSATSGEAVHSAVPLMLIFALTALFVLLVDALGTPYMMLKSGEPPKPKAVYKKLVQRGFEVEAIAGMTSVFLQGSPAVCYAESSFAKELRAIRGAPAVIAGILFLAVLTAACVWPAGLHSLLASVPLISLSPLLATIAIIIMIAGFGSGPAPAPDSMLDKVQHFLPRVFAVSGAFAGQLSIGITVGILFEWVVAGMRGQPRDGVFHVLAILSLIALVTIFVLMR